MFKFILIVLFISINIFASGTYNARSAGRRNAGSAKEEGTPKSIQSLKAFIYSMDRTGVTINEITADERKFEIMGVYEKKDDLKNFIENIKYHARKKKNFQVIFNTSSFAGHKTYHYHMIGKNKW